MVRELAVIAARLTRARQAAMAHAPAARHRRRDQALQ
jgi:hypothetical protein